MAAESKSASPPDASTEGVVRSWAAKLRANLFGSVLPFWREHSFDGEHGGFFDCLDEDGDVYDTTKHVWLQGRQVWMYCRIINMLRTSTDASVEERKQTARLFEQAEQGVNFLRRHATAANGHVYFALASDGTPAQMQRKPFSACFLAMALSEWARTLPADDPRAVAVLQDAQDVTQRMLGWTRTPGALGKESLPGSPKLAPLAVPMMVVCVVKDLVRGRPELGKLEVYTTAVARAVAEIKSHVHAERKMVLENVGPGGEYHDSIEGRQLNPGHAIECGWFLLQHANETEDAELRDLALRVIQWSFERGWDTKHGGIWYFLDAAGRSPVQLEWNMKLWWPHCEAMIAFALAFVTTHERKYLDEFVRVSEYAFSHFVDAEHGEWYGYLNEEGRVTHRFKGGPYKGCFHVPRALLMCSELLAQYSKQR